MSSRHVEARGGGVGFGSLLTIAFIVLKLTGVIDWSWIWVLAPVWIAAGIVLVCGLVLMVIAVLSGGRR